MTTRDPVSAAAEAGALISKLARERNKARAELAAANVKLDKVNAAVDVASVVRAACWEAAQEIVEVFEADSYDHPHACHGAHEAATFLANRPHHYGICHPDAWELA